VQLPLECPEVPPVAKEGSEEGHVLHRHEMEKDVSRRCQWVRVQLKEAVKNDK